MNKDLKEVRGKAIGTSKGRPFQAEGAAHAKVLRQKQGGQVQKTARRPMWPEQSE